jgi:multicomponent Na+:H+ antiporter subunit B
VQDNLILRVVAKWLVPVILLFAFYVQFHGDYSPGGGFQAGVIFSSAFLLYALVYGLDATTKVLPHHLLKTLASAGVLLYTSVGIFGLVNGGEFLNYKVLANTPLAGQHLGIIIVEIGVGITVSSVMLLIFFAFARRIISQ